MCTYSKATAALLLFSVISLTAFAQNFENISAGLEPLYQGKISWSDLDGDGDLDLIYSGFKQGANEYHTNVYENAGGTFALRATSLPNLRNGEIILGDYDGDGDPDVLMSGLSESGNISSLYKNDGAFSFSLASSFPGLINSTASWADIDNDEDLDLVIAGADDDTGTPDAIVNKIFVYRNDGVTFALLADTHLPACSQCAMDWADANNDGRIDVAITTRVSSNTYHTELYLNDGGNSFTSDESQGLPELYNGDVQWGDFDRDGNMDLLVSGVRADGTIATEVYQNNAGKLQLMDAIDILYVAENWHDGTRWVDYNNDGLLDIVLSGRGTSILDVEYVFSGFLNNGDSTFTQDDIGIEGITDSSIDFGDFDNDGDVDMVYMGQTAQGAVTGILKNKLRSAPFVGNSAPQPPALAGLSEKFYRKETRLMWTDGSDAQTPTDGLSYNFWLQQGSTKRIVPTANRSTGYVTTANAPNGHAQNIVLPDLAEGNHSWGVQAVDGVRAGSAFTAPKAFYKLNGPEAVKAEIIDETHVKLSWIDNSAAETSYRIERSTAPGTGYATRGTPAANSTTFSDNFAFVAETYYYYRIYAVNATTSSGYDSLKILIPAAAENPYARWAQAGRIGVSWDDMSDNETGFEIERRLASAANFSVVGHVTADVVEFTDRGLTEGTDYVYRIRTVNEYGYGAYSGPTTITTNFRPHGADVIKNGVEDHDVMFTAQEFTDAFSDPDADDAFHSIFIATVPARGALKLNTVAVSAGQQIMRNALAGLVYSPAKDDNGRHSFDFYYSDGKDSSTVAYHVNMDLAAVNDPPVFTLPARLALDEDFQATTLKPEMSIPADEQNQVLTWTLAPAEVTGIATEFDAATGTLKLSPVQDASGKWQFTITAHDGEATNGSHSATVDVTVDAVNDVPFISLIEDIAVEKAQPVPSVTLVVTDPDSPIGNITFGVTSDNQAVIKNSNLHLNGLVLSMTPELKVGKAVITVRATDGISVGTREFTLEILTITAVERFTPGVDVYPNPVERSLQISVGDNFSPPFRILLRDALGRPVLDRVIEGHESQVDFAELKAGMYFLEILSPKNEVLYQGKISRK